MAERKVIGPMLVEAPGDHVKNVTRFDVESALMLSRIRSKCSNQKIDAVIRLYFTLKAVPLENDRFFLIDGISGVIESFILGVVNTKLPIVEKLSSGISEPETLREILKTNTDRLLDFDNYEVLTFRGMIDPEFKKGVQDWVVHATYDAATTSLFLPEVIRSENPENLVKSLKGLEIAFETQISSCVDASSNLRQTLQKIEARIKDNLSSISLSPSMEDQKKELLEKIKALGDERDKKVSQTEEKLTSIKSNLSHKLKDHVDRVEELTQRVRASENLVKQLVAEQEYALQVLQSEESKLESTENEFLTVSRKLRELEIKSGKKTTKKFKSESDEESKVAAEKDAVSEQRSSSGQAQVEKLERKIDGDLLDEKLHQKEQTIEDLSLQAAKLNFLLPQIRSRVNELKSNLELVESKLKSSKSQMESNQNSLNSRTEGRIMVTNQEEAMIEAMKDDIAQISYEYQSKIENVLKHVSTIEAGVKEQEYQFHTLKREVEYRVAEISQRFDSLAQRNKDAKRRLFDDSVIVLPSAESVPLEIVFPIYIIFSRTGKRRFKILLPAYVSKLSSAEVRKRLIETNVKNRFVKILLASHFGNRLVGRLLGFSGSSTLSFTEPEGFDAEEERISSIIERDVDLANWLMSVFPSTDLLTQSDFFDNVNSGLQKLQADKTVSKAEVSELRNWALELSAV